MAKPRRKPKPVNRAADRFGGPVNETDPEEDLGVIYLDETGFSSEPEGLLYCKKHNRIEFADSYSRQMHKQYVPPSETSPLTEHAIALFVIKAEHITPEHRRHALAHSTAENPMWFIGKPRIPYRNDCRKCLVPFFQPDAENGNSD